MVAALAVAYAEAGRTEEARRLLEELRGRASREHVRAVSLAGIYSALGQPDEPFLWLERAYKDRDVAFASFRGTLPAPAFLGVAPRTLRSDPRNRVFCE